MDGRYSTSSKASIAAAVSHWDVICDKWGWSQVIKTGDINRGAKLATFVLHLMAHERLYPSSTIRNYVWALCAFMQLRLQLDPRINVVGWSFFMSAVNVMCFVPYEPRTRLPTASIRSALAAVDTTSFPQVQTALLVLFLYFTFQRSEFPCPKTYDGLDPAKHCLVSHMEPFEGGTRWAVGTTKADPRAERLTSDAAPGREWIVIGEVDDELFDMRVWLGLFYSFFPSGPRDGDAPFFVAHDMKRCLTYQTALADFRDFLGGHVDDVKKYGLHSARSEGFITCSGAVTEEAAVIQGGWRGKTSFTRYDRLTMPVALSIASKMVAHHRPDVTHTSDHDSSDDEPAGNGHASGGGGLGIAAARAAARTRPVACVRRTGASTPGAASAEPPPGPAPAAAGSRASRPTSAPSPCHQPANLPAGWRRIWHPTEGRRAGFESFLGPNGQTARTVFEARRAADGWPIDQPPPPVASVVTADNLDDHVRFFDRPSARRPPRERVR